MTFAPESCNYNKTIDFSNQLFLIISIVTPELTDELQS